MDLQRPLAVYPSNYSSAKVARQQSYLSLASAAFANSGQVDANQSDDSEYINKLDKKQEKQSTSRSFQWGTSLFLHGILLFCTGCALFKMFTTLTPIGISNGACILFGIMALTVGILLPILDLFTPDTSTVLFNDTRLFWERAGWSTAMRYISGFIGLAWAAQKLQWTSAVQLGMVLAVVSIGIWFLFDRTQNGAFMGAVFGMVGLVAVLSFPTLSVFHGDITATAWVPSVVFSFCIAFGNMGRLLLTSV
jgi:hypothetical protein